MSARVKTIRLGVHEAAQGLDCDRKTLASSLKSQGLEAGRDGKFSLLEIFHARFGDQQAEDLLLTRAKRETAETELQKTREQLLPVAMIDRAWEAIVITVRQKFLGMPSKLQSRLGLTETQTKIIEEEIHEALTEQSKKPDYNATEKQEEE